MNYKLKRVIFDELKERGFLDNLEGKRILEIGPKHGKDSVMLATLKPKELVLVDLPSKTGEINKWLHLINCKKTHIEGDILEIDGIGKFDLIWCLGVLYHNDEQLRIIRKIFSLCNRGSSVVVESATTKNGYFEKHNLIELHWPKPHKGVQTITHLPSRLAIKSWMEIAGFADVRIRDIYPARLDNHRAVITGVR